MVRAVVGAGVVAGADGVGVMAELAGAAMEVEAAEAGAFL
jgi:hypothetical protein